MNIQQGKRKKRNPPINMNIFQDPQYIQRMNKKEVAYAPVTPTENGGNQKRTTPLKISIFYTFEEVDFLWNRTVDSLKTSFHLLL